MRTAKRCALLFIWLLVATAISYPISFILDTIYSLLNKYFKTAFPKYSPFLQPVEYEIFSAAFSITVFTIAIFISVWLSVRYCNERYEYIISKTDGLYDVKDVIHPYVKRFALSDAIASVISPLPFIIGAIFLPERLYKYAISFPFKHAKILLESFGVFGSIAFMVLVVAMMHIPAVLLALGHYRARWLCAFHE